MEDYCLIFWWLLLSVVKFSAYKIRTNYSSLLDCKIDRTHPSTVFTTKYIYQKNRPPTVFSTNNPLLNLLSFK